MAADPEEITALAIPEARAVANWTPRFALTVDEAVGLVEMKRQFMSRVMRKDEHYGPVPGTDKPTLLKPGAELLLSAMGLLVDCSIDATPPIVDLAGKNYGGEAYVQFHKVAEIYRYDNNGERRFVARASGNCNSWEKKYRYRSADRVCPNCGKAAIIKGKAEFGGGWLCFKKKDGCGAKFAANDPQIAGQPGGQVPNPEIADLVNTIEKMAEKRAMVAATLVATGCSDLFTQDMEDHGYADHGESEQGSRSNAVRFTGTTKADLGGKAVAAPAPVAPPAPRAKVTNPIVIKPQPKEAEVIEGSAVEVEQQLPAAALSPADLAVAYAEELARISLQVTGRPRKVVDLAREMLDKRAKESYGRLFGNLTTDEIESLIDRLSAAIKAKGGKLPGGE